MFPRLELHACTILFSYHGISLIYVLFHFPCAISIEQRFSNSFLNGQFTCHTIKILIELRNEIVEHSETHGVEKVKL